MNYLLLHKFIAPFCLGNLVRFYMVHRDYNILWFLTVTFLPFNIYRTQLTQSYFYICKRSDFEFTQFGSSLFYSFIQFKLLGRIYQYCEVQLDTKFCIIAFVSILLNIFQDSQYFRYEIGYRKVFKYIFVNIYLNIFRIKLHLYSLIILACLKYAQVNFAYFLRFFDPINTCVSNNRTIEQQYKYTYFSSFHPVVSSFFKVLLIQFLDFQRSVIQLARLQIYKKNIYINQQLINILVCASNIFQRQTLKISCYLQFQQVAQIA
eukprot:TRINITY_DN4124_c0_g1_i8.p1 TRINITY_DN4124_c0_g1~~TRINITY_DN4124_c0_g1_i8.p1  ORF type:complete len:263 (+),score=-20.80 TRINITY_DN4124_c0_g1_i8:99-887(+)